MKIPDIQNHIIVTLSAWGSRVIIAAVQLLAVRILIQNLGTEGYAVFALLYGLTGWYLLSDLGLGFSVQNFISEHRIRGEDDDNLILLSGFVSLLLFAIQVLLLFMASKQLGGAFLHQFGFLSEIEKGSLFFGASIMLIGTGIGTVSYRIWYGQQRGHLANIAPALGALGSLIAVWLVTRFNLTPKLLWSLIGFLAPNTLVALGGLTMQLANRWKPFHLWMHWDTLQSISARAGQFWIFSLLGAGVLQVDCIVISQVLSSDQIVVYTITTRIFLFVGLIYSSALLAVWPVFAELTLTHAWRLVMNNLRKYILAGFCFVILCTAVLVLKMSVIIHILSPNYSIDIPRGLILLLGVYYIVRVWTDSFATVLQSMSDLRPLWAAVAAQAALSAFLEWRLAVRWGPYGVVVGLISSYLLTVAWWIPFKVARHRSNASVKTNAEAIYLHSNI